MEDYKKRLTEAYNNNNYEEYCNVLSDIKNQENKEILDEIKNAGVDACDLATSVLNDENYWENEEGENNNVAVVNPTEPKEDNSTDCINR